MKIDAPIVHEVQTITIQTGEGTHLGGGFYVHYNGYNTSLIDHDVNASNLKEIIEDSLNPAKINILDDINRTNLSPGIGRVEVSSVQHRVNRGHKWKITFLSAVGNVEQLTITNKLEGLNQSILVETVSEGNSIGGFFKLNFLNSTTRPIEHDISASALEILLMEDIKGLEMATSRRIDSNRDTQCNDGLCPDGPTQAGGYTWTLTLTTRIGNISPSNPSSIIFDEEGPIENLTTENHLTGCVLSLCPTVEISKGHANSPTKILRKVTTTKPFSLSLNGVGGSHGGKGGISTASHGNINPGPTCGDPAISRDLLGGSGGAQGVLWPHEAIMFENSFLRGGNGGGAVELVAANDIVLGPYASISCNGQSGSHGYTFAGGGGAGGSILLASNGSIDLDDNVTLSAKGGNGGTIWSSLTVDSGGGGGGGGRIALYSNSINLGLNDIAKLDVSGGTCNDIESAEDACYYACCGQQGSIYVREQTFPRVSLDLSRGAIQTLGSLRISSKFRIRDRYDNQNKSFTRHEGNTKPPQIYFGANLQPERVSFYVMLGKSSSRTISRQLWTASLELVHGYPDDKEEDLVLIGMALGEDAIMHGPSYNAVNPWTGSHLDHLDSVHIVTGPNELNRWYHFDTRIDWDSKTYDIHVDSILIASRVAFNESAGVEANATSLRIQLGHENMVAWVDEIYIGPDNNTLGFSCPLLGSHENRRPEEMAWHSTDIGPTQATPNRYHSKVRHPSHLYERKLYQHDIKTLGGFYPFDGEGHIEFSSEIPETEILHSPLSAEPIVTKRKLNTGSIFKVPDVDDENVASSQRSRKTYVWYGEHYDSKKFGGGIGACSTTDELLVWKNEGIMLNFANLTDMVHNTPGPFRAQRPKVLYNSMTQYYVMWFTMTKAEEGILETDSRLGMAGIALSRFATGPFIFVRSFYPDGNRTFDQTVHQRPSQEEGAPAAAFLIRTFYQTVDYVLPSPVMQPIWQSVQKTNSEDPTKHTTNFALNYHRAVYEPGYDDYHDIFEQRWRKEDTPWKVICVHKLTGAQRVIEYGLSYLNQDGEMCHHAMETKLVIGQGIPDVAAGPSVKTRYLDPSDPINSEWIPDSVPSVKAQPWSANYKDGICGFPQFEENQGKNLSCTDPDTWTYLSQSRANGDKPGCSNMADNPIHPTPPDLLIGFEQTVQQRRAKYIAISRLTDDYLDTNGEVHIIEGSLYEHSSTDASGRDANMTTALLNRLIDEHSRLFSSLQSNQHSDFGKNVEGTGSLLSFEWISDKANTSRIDNTEHAAYIPVQSYSYYFGTDYQQEIIFQQYARHFNDRAYYSPACIIDGICPVNMKDQTTTTKADN